MQSPKDMFDSIINQARIMAGQRAVGNAMESLAKGDLKEAERQTRMAQRLADGGTGSKTEVVEQGEPECPQ